MHCMDLHGKEQMHCMDFHLKFNIFLFVYLNEVEFIIHHN